MTRNSHGLAYRPDIDGLRAVAILAVLGFHAFPGYLPGGFFGVDVFFVLSGYLITSLIAADVTAGRFSIRDFYARRIRRLFPAALLVIAAVCAVGYALFFSYEFARLLRHAWASLFFVENVLLANEQGYFDVGAASKPLLHFWSLAVEEQFYLVWPLVLSAAIRWPRTVLPIIGLILVASFLLAVSSDLSPAWRFYSPLLRAWELATGAALAWTATRQGPPRLLANPSAANAASVVALLALMLSLLIGPRGQLHPGWITLLPVLATALLIATGPAALGNARLLSARPAVWIGLISYPLYLWHWPLLSYVVVVTGDRGSTLLRAALLVLAFILAFATYRCVERPLRFRWRRGRALTILVSAYALLAALLVVPLVLRPPHTDRIAEIADDQLEGVGWRYTANDTCKSRQQRHFSAFCLQTGGPDPQVLFIGNSYANHLFPGIALQPAFRGVSMLAFGSCELSRKFPIGIYGKDQCDDQLEMLRRYSSIGLVIVANQWSMFDETGKMTDLQSGDAGKASEYPDAREYERGLRSTFAEIAARGVPVVIFGPKPELGYDVANCYGRPFRPAARDCRMLRAAFERSAAVTSRFLKAIAADYPNLHYLDMTPVFCGATICSYRAADGTPLLRDSGHFSVAGSLYVAQYFIRWARKEGLRLPDAPAHSGAVIAPL